MEKFPECDLRSGNLFLAVLIGFSQMYFYVHYPTVVLAGAGRGAALAVLFAVSVRKIYRRQGYECVGYTFCPVICLLTFVIKYYGLFSD